MSNPIARANNDFAFRFLAAQRPLEPPGDLFFSPYSLSSALAMTLNGASGETLHEMRTTLGLGRTGRKSINQAQAELRQQLELPGEGITLGIANSLWAALNVPLKAEFVQHCAEYYAARAASVDFQDPQTLAAINNWVAEKTCDRIKNLLHEENLVPPPVLILINAIYFKGLWRSPFRSELTHPVPFYLSDGAQHTVQLMRQSESFEYLETDAVQIASLVYGRGQFSLEVCLPSPDRSLDQLLAGLDESTWQGWLNHLRMHEIELGLPRFRMEYGAEVGPALKQMGMQLAFSPEADFSQITSGPLLIDQVIHRAFLEVNEQGSEAAAATAVMMKRGALIMSKPRMIVDRPFLCAIRHRPSEAILFLGAIYKPESPAQP
jgi:serine protease inhibitor